MVTNNLTGGPLCLSVFVILYSILCLSLSSLLSYLLWKHDSRITYVFFISLLTSLQSAASIIQQIHFATDYHTIKEHEFQVRLDKQMMSEVIINSGAQGLDKGLFWIQFYGYNANAILVFFWAIQLFKGTWDLRLGSSRWATYVSSVSKVFAIVFPAVLLVIANAPSILSTPLTFLILCNLMLAVSLIGGSITLALTLYKFVQARRKLNSLSGSGMGSRAHASRSMTGREDTIATNAAEARRRRDERWIIVRFTIAFIILGIFELCIILFQYLGYSSYISTDSPTIDLSTSSQITSIAQFIPGVTASLVAFLVWGTTSTFRAEIGRIFTCSGAGKRGSGLANQERGGGVPDYFERLPTRNEERINVTTELTIINVGKKEVRIKEWEESDEDTNNSIKEMGGRPDGNSFVASATSTGAHKPTSST